MHIKTNNIAMAMNLQLPLGLGIYVLDVITYIYINDQGRLLYIT